MSPLNFWTNHVVHLRSNRGYDLMAICFLLCSYNYTKQLLNSIPEIDFLTTLLSFRQLFSKYTPTESLSRSFHELKGKYTSIKNEIKIQTLNQGNPNCVLGQILGTDVLSTKGESWVMLVVVIKNTPHTYIDQKHEIYFANFGKYEAYFPKLVIENTPRTQAALAKEKGHVQLSCYKDTLLLTCFFSTLFKLQRRKTVGKMGKLLET